MSMYKYYAHTSNGKIYQEKQEIRELVTDYDRLSHAEVKFKLLIELQMIKISED